MDAKSQETYDKLMEGLKRRNPGEPEFHQAVAEVAADIVPFVARNPKYQNMMLLERLTEPDRIITFRVSWLDDEGNIRADRGYRVQNNNAIGPYKGGIRFQAGVSLSVLKFLAFEQTFKNSLTGKGLEYGGSLIRAEATGYGTVYMLENMLRHHKRTLEGQSIAVSGAGNVAIYAAEKAMQLGARVITLSDSSGFLHVPEGLDSQQLEYIKVLKFKRRSRLADFLAEYEAHFHPAQRPWSVPCDIALPCATQNEIALDDARSLVKNGCRTVVEGANMPATQDAIHVFLNNSVLFAPSKAANAGGVAVSGLEMSQNSARMSWSEEEIHQHLRRIMGTIHEKCVQHGQEKGYINYSKGANIAGFIKVAEAMLAYGVI